MFLKVVRVTDRMAGVVQCQLQNKNWPLFREVSHNDVVVLEIKPYQQKVSQFVKKKLARTGPQSSQTKHTDIKNVIQQKGSQKIRTSQWQELTPCRLPRRL